MTTAVEDVKHPAKFTESIIVAAAAMMDEDWSVIDPFAGTGRVHLLADYYGIRSTVGVEIEPEWAQLDHRTIVGDALALPFSDGTFDCVFTSPVYGNRMSDHHDAKDTSRRITYRHYLGRPLHEHNAGRLQWGPKYKMFHDAAWREARRVLRPGGTFLLNVSDHIRKGEHMEVTDWHVWTLLELGFQLCEWQRIETPRMRMGRNAEKRVDHESLLRFVLPC